MIIFGVAPYAKATPVAFDWFEYKGRDEIFATPLPAGHYRNPILAGFYPDPSICRVGDDYYLINSTFAYFPGIPVFHSRDLVNWEQLGHVIDRPTQLDYSKVTITHGLFAPAISHHNGTFYVVCTMIDGGGNFLVTAKNPAGPWSDPIWLKFDGIDPSLFFDDDGRAWLVNNGNPPNNQPLYSGHRAIWIQEFDPTKNQLTGPRSIIVNGGTDLAKKPVWIEGPHLYKRNGWYYLCCAEGGTSDQHSQVILRSKAPTGPFVPWEKNPILTQRYLDNTAPQAVTCTGHADLVVGPDGNWWATFLGCRPFAGKYWTTGRETFLLPVKWTDDGWPQIMPPGERVPYVAKAPGLILQEKPESTERTKTSSVSSVTSCEKGPFTGNFTWRDDFKTPQLSPLWVMLRTPREAWWALADGKLHLEPRADTLSDRGNPSFLGRRVQHARFDASVQLAVPNEPKASAGLVLLQNEDHYYYLGVRRTEASVLVFLEKRDGKTSEVFASAAIPAIGTLRLKFSANETDLGCAFATQDGPWQTLSPQATTAAITVQAAGGGLHFTGAVVGPYARKDP
ncbi:MAG TPA: glycoside hydrolase family 43 protein [Lacunisphaera sp.]